MSLADSAFRFSVLLKNDQDIGLEALELFPHMAEINFNSRIFPGYAECIRSCKSLLEDMSTSINEVEGKQRFKVGAEVNPLHSGTPTMSQDWLDDEIARFWVYDKTMEGTGERIDAICKGSVFSIAKEVSSETFH